jgi:hypothetical protein
VNGLDGQCIYGHALRLEQGHVTTYCQECLASPNGSYTYRRCEYTTGGQVILPFRFVAGGFELVKPSSVLTREELES